MTKKRPRADPVSSCSTARQNKRSQGTNSNSNNNKHSNHSSSSSNTFETNAKQNDDTTKPTNLRDQTSLRYISKRVSKKVERKQTTNYNEVANELVGEASELLDKEAVNMTSKERKNHEKNIRRRVYDALNVLLATDIITRTKDKDNKEKTIHWKGFPTNTRNDLALLEKEKEEVMMEVERKKQCLEELLVQNICFHNLDKRNSSSRGSQPAGATVIAQDKEGSSSPEKDSQNKKNGESDLDEKIPLPFIVVNTSEKAVIQCEMNREKTDVMFDFNMPFEINDDNEILKRLGLNKTTHEELKRILPADILQYCQEKRLLDNVLLPIRSSSNISGNSNSISLPPRQQYPHPSSYHPPPPGYSHPPHHPVVSSYHPPHPAHAHLPHPHPPVGPPPSTHGHAPPHHHHPARHPHTHPPHHHHHQGPHPPHGPHIPAPPNVYRGPIPPPPNNAMMPHHPNHPHPPLPTSHVASSSSTTRHDDGW